MILSRKTNWAAQARTGALGAAVRATTLLAALLLCGGCGRSGVAGELAAFRDAGHTVTGFAALDATSFAAKKCESGTVDQFPVLLCEYENGYAAALGQAAAESWGGTSGTMIVVHRGPMLFAVADRNKTEPSGKTLSALAKLFRRIKAP